MHSTNLRMLSSPSPPLPFPLFPSPPLPSSIPHLDSSLSLLVVKVTGTSLMPYCHFELEESDYLTSGRRVAETHPLQPGAPTPAPRDISTKVIEFHSCGLGVKHVR